MPWSSTHSLFWDSSQCQGGCIWVVLICIIILDTPYSHLGMGIYTIWILAELIICRVGSVLTSRISYWDNILQYMREKGCDQALMMVSKRWLTDPWIHHYSLRSNSNIMQLQLGLHSIHSIGTSCHTLIVKMIDNTKLMNSQVVLPLL